MADATQAEREAVVSACERIMALHGCVTRSDGLSSDRIFSRMLFRSYLADAGMSPEFIKDLPTGINLFLLYAGCLTRTPLHPTPTAHLDLFYPDAFSARQMDVACREAESFTSHGSVMGAEERAFKVERLRLRKAKAEARRVARRRA